MIFLAAFTGLIGAACVNGFPSITCYALADAYTIALANLGFIFVIALLTFVVIMAVEISYRNANIYTINTLGLRLGIAGPLLLVFLSVAFSFYLIMKTTIHGVKNIQIASPHCLEDTPQNKRNPYDRIPLLRSLFSDIRT
jgi:hypothetical protein